MCAAPSQQLGLGREVGRERGATSGSWLVAHRSHQFFDFPVWFPPHGVSRRDQTTVRLAQAQEVFELFPSLGRGLHLVPRFGKSTSDLDNDAATEWGHTALGPSTSTDCPKKSFAEASSRGYAGGNPYAGHPCSPPFLRNTALIPVACLHGKPERYRIQLACSGSHTASPSDRAVELQR